MKQIKEDFLDRLNEISTGKFEISDVDMRKLFLRNLGNTSINYYIYYGNITKEEVTKLVEITTEACRASKYDRGPFGQNNARVVFTNDVNTHSAYSPQFVRAILDLEASALHKLLLLVSGLRIMSKGLLEPLTVLAQTKSEFDSDLEIIAEIAESQRINIENSYILPGVSVDTLGIGHGSTKIHSFTAGQNQEAEFRGLDVGFMNVFQVMAFFSEDSEMTMREFLSREDFESILTRKKLRDMKFVSCACKALDSQYSEIALSMNSQELQSLGVVLGDTIDSNTIPFDFLLHRVKAVVSKSQITAYRSISSYLSGLEIQDTTEDLPSSEIEIGNHLPRVCYAALAEVVAVKGQDRALEVIKELSVIPKDSDSSFHSSVVLLILEALKSELDDYPFSWVAQMSEHSWVLNGEKEFVDNAFLVTV